MIFLKDRYDYELKRKDQITAALTLPVGVLIALGTVMAAMARSFSYRDGYLTWCFLIFLLLAAVAFLLCVVLPRPCLPSSNVLVSTAAKRTPEDPREVAGRRLHKGSVLRRTRERVSHQRGEDLFQRVLEMRIIGAADENTKNNDMRGDRYLYRARVAIFVVLGLTAITGVTYVLDQVRY